MSQHVDIGIETASSFTNGATIIGTSAIQVIAPGRKVNKGVQLKSHVGNTATIFIGKKGVTALTDVNTDGLPLDPGEGIFIPVEDISLIYAIASAVSQRLTFIAI